MQVQGVAQAAAHLHPLRLGVNAAQAAAQIFVGALLVVLTTFLGAGAAFGMRYIISTQTVSGMETRWRNQISLYLAAFQPSQSADQPNTGLTTKELLATGGTPPSQLPPPPDGAGVFTACWGHDALTFRAGLMDDAQRQRWLDLLPDWARQRHVSEPVPCWLRLTPTLNKRLRWCYCIAR